MLNQNSFPSYLKKYCFFIVCLWISTTAFAQDTVKQVKKETGPSLKDTAGQRRRRMDSSFFADYNTPGKSDYLEAFENIFQELNKVPALTASFTELNNIRYRLEEADSTLAILKTRLSVNDQALTIRNLQMYNTLLDELDNTVSDFTDNLTDYSDTLKQVKMEVFLARKDTLIRHAFRDSALHVAFQSQLDQLRSKWKLADSLIKKNTAEINDLKAHASANSIIIAELLYKTDAGSKKLTASAFNQEQGYLWEPAAGRSNAPSGNYKNSWRDERKLTRYYFVNTSSNRHWLLLTALVFFYWVWSNFRSLRRMDKMEAIRNYKFRYISPKPVIVSIVFLLTLAPLFDLHAPAVYIEFTQSLLMLLLVAVFHRSLSHRAFVQWCVFICLFLLFSVIRVAGMTPSLERWSVFFLNLAAIVFGLLFLFKDLKTAELKGQKFVGFAIILFVALNVLALLCNLSGRVTLSDILGLTAFYAFAQSASLAVFVQTVEEAFLLQIQSRRIRKHYTEYFDSRPIAKSIFRISAIVAVFLWLIVFTTNLTIYDDLNDWLMGICSTPRHIGNISFTYSGIALFLCIVWGANFLQRYIAYFLGDTGDDAAMEDKGQRSKLLITRLVLLIAGFLLAVAASGLPLDKITVILGALGVGVGLGLQNIVNNFVSGVVLIFDRPLRIGDTVELGDKKGRVKEINIRSSTLLTENGAEVIIPNGDILSHNIVNWTLSNNHVRVMLSFTLDKTDDTTVMQEEIKEIVQANSNVLKHKDPEIVMSITGPKSQEMKVYFWCKDIYRNDITSSDVKSAIYSYFGEKGIVVS